METKKKNIWITILKILLIICFLPIFLLFLVIKSDKIDSNAKKVLTVILILFSLIWFVVGAIISTGNRSDKSNDDIPILVETEQTAVSTSITSPVTTASSTTTTVKVTTEATSTVPEEVTSISESDKSEETISNPLLSHTVRYNSFQNYKYYYITVPETEMYGLTTKDLRDFHDSINDDATNFSIVIGDKILFAFPFMHYGSYGTYFSSSDYSIDHHNCDIDYSGDKFIVSTCDKNGEEVIEGEYDTFTAEMFRSMDTMTFYKD